MSQNSANPRSEFAKLSDIAYSIPSERQNKLKEIGLDNQYDISDNTNEAYTALHKHRPIAVVVHRGTSLEHNPIRDLGSDLSIVTNDFKDTQRYKEALEKVQHAKQKYHGHRHVFTTGHSLGGTIAHTTGQAANVHSYAFNPGSSPQFRLNETNRNMKTKHHIYKVHGDWIAANVSNTGQPSNTHIHHFSGTERLPSHSVENFY